MKSLLTSLLVVLAGLILFVVLKRSVPPPVNGEPQRLQSFQEEVPAADPPAESQPYEVTGASNRPTGNRISVQSLEERGDAMLFEAEALDGTPFDKEIVRPFAEDATRSQ